MRHPIRIHRLYDPGAPAGARILVDRLWPRGVTKERLAADEWLKAIAPSNDLRRWFHADTSRWDEFQTRYRAELAANPEPVAHLLTLAEARPVILLYGAKDPARNHALVLRDYLQARA